MLADALPLYPIFPTLFILYTSFFIFHSSFFFFHFSLIFAPLSIRPGAEIGRQACLRGMCSLGREGSSPSPGTSNEK